MTYLKILVLFFLAQNVFAQETLVDKAFCEQFVIDHKPDDDVEYKPDLDMGPPADLNGSIKIIPPKNIKIPIRFDLSKYFGVSEKQTTQNQQQISANLQNLNQNGVDFDVNAANINTNLSNIQLANNALNNAVAQPIFNQNDAQNSLVNIVGQMQNSIDALDQTSSQLLNSSDALIQNYGVLKKQFNPYEKDPVIKSENRTLKEQTQNALDGHLDNLKRSADQVASLQNQFNQTKEAFDKAPLTFQNTSGFSEQLAGLNDQLSSLQQSYDAVVTPGSNHLTALKQKMKALDNPKNNFLDYAELGYVEMKEDGRIYFNDQPLFNEDNFALIQACKELNQ